MKRIVIDVDGCLASWNRSFAALLRGNGANLRDFEDGSDPLLWDWYETYGATKAQVKASWDWILQHPGWWASLSSHRDFTPAAQFALDNLCRYHEVTFVSSRPNGRDDLVRWLKHHLAAWDDPQVLLTPGDKVLALTAMQPHVIIEDRVNTLRDYAQVQFGATAKMPQAELILIKRPYTDSYTDGLTVVNSTLEAFERAAEVVSLKEVA